MDEPVEALGPCVYARLQHLGREQLALVPQGVTLVDDDQCRRQTGDVGGVEGHAWVGASLGARGVLLAESRKVVELDHVALRELPREALWMVAFTSG